MRFFFSWLCSVVFFVVAVTVTVTDAQASVPAPSPKPSPQQKKSKGMKIREKETEGTEALNRFEADTVIKSQYQLGGTPLEVDPD